MQEWALRSVRLLTQWGQGTVYRFVFTCHSLYKLWQVNTSFIGRKRLLTSAAPRWLIHLDVSNVFIEEAFFRRTEHQYPPWGWSWGFCPWMLPQACHFRRHLLQLEVEIRCTEASDIRIEGSWGRGPASQTDVCRPEPWEPGAERGCRKKL